MSYKVKCSKIHARNRTHLLSLKGERCYLGVSLHSPFINGKYIDQVLKWIDDHFAKCLILIGDDVYRHTELIFGASLSEAEQNCIALGKAAEDKLQQAINNTGSNKFQIVRWNECTSEEGYLRQQEHHRSLSKHNAVFNSALILCAEQFLAKQEKRKREIRVAHEVAVAHCVDYILEEMAVFSMMINSGFRTLVYPGSNLPIFSDLLNETIPVETSLKEGIYIDLIVKKN